MNAKPKAPSTPMLVLAIASVCSLYWAAFKEESLFLVVCASICTVLVADLIRIKLATPSEESKCKTY